ncbi:hypothetical protein [Streptomyces sp. NPDC001415]
MSPTAPSREAHPPVPRNVAAGLDEDDDEEGEGNEDADAGADDEGDAEPVDSFPSVAEPPPAASRQPDAVSSNKHTSHTGHANHINRGNRAKRCVRIRPTRTPQNPPDTTQA